MTKKPMVYKKWNFQKQIFKIIIKSNINYYNIMNKLLYTKIEGQNCYKFKSNFTKLL